MIHTVKCFSTVNEAEVFLELSCFFYDPMDIGNLISGSSTFPKSSLNIWKLSVHVLLKPNLENHMGLECKYRMPRDTWSNRQDWLWSTKWSKKRLTVLPRECTGHNKHLLPKTQEMTPHLDITRWSLNFSGYHHWNQIDYILCSQWWRSIIQSAKTRTGADCGQIPT